MWWGINKSKAKGAEDGGETSHGVWFRERDTEEERKMLRFFLGDGMSPSGNSTCQVFGGKTRLRWFGTVNMLVGGG